MIILELAAVAFMFWSAPYVLMAIAQMMINLGVVLANCRL